MANDKMQKSNLWKNKKAVNDISILMGITLFFVSMGLFLPIIHESFGSDVSTPNLDALTQGIAAGSVMAVDPIGGFELATGSSNLWTILNNIFKMFFWTYGLLPWWLDAIFIPLRVVFAFLVARNVWIGGGG